MSYPRYPFYWVGESYSSAAHTDRSWGRPEGSLFNSYYTEVWGRVLLLSLDCSTLPLIHTLYCWVLIKEVSSTIFKVFGMTWPGIEPRSPRSLANTLPTRPMSRIFHTSKQCEILTKLRIRRPNFLEVCSLSSIGPFILITWKIVRVNTLRYLIPRRQVLTSECK